jgi:hypothetical protein
MYRRCDREVTVRHLFTVLLSISLVCSFGLHSIQTTHTHFGGGHGHESEHAAGGGELSAYMHLADKKVFAVALFVFLAPWTFLVSSLLFRLRLSLYLERRVVFRIRMLSRMWNIYFEYFKIIFRKGILNTKVF